MTHTDSSKHPSIADYSALESIETRIGSAALTQAATNAFSHLDTRNALHEAEKLNVSNKVQNDKPLWGVIASVKDSFHVPAMPRWHGSAAHPGAVSTTASVPVQRLVEAGAIILGKTTMPDFGLLASGVSSTFGVTRNPWDLSASPGGSSSGAGVAVATGATPFALGTDIAGSVRLPAAHCGITALKPTQGALAYAPASTWRSAGPMARTVRETRKLFQVVAIPDPSDQLSREIPRLNQERPRSLRGVNIGVMEHPGYGPRADSTTAQLFRNATDLFADQGAHLTAVLPNLHDTDFEALNRCLMVRCIAELEGCPAERRDSLLEEIRIWAAPGRDLSAVDYFRDFEHLSTVSARISAQFASYDLIVSPVMGVHRFPATDFGPDTTAPLLYHANFTAWFNQTGQPALSLPMGLSSEGHPVGLQLAGPHGSDFALLEFAETVEELLALTLEYPDATKLQPQHFSS
ncbi:amidase [Leucobacter insecticola]|uniref:Amidase n=1 Tax=Leucobacter insecticola TaxID=2714934 RepID=A0A6G8FKZ2_9MICO|nr:amidase [Leucobacter insecticola]QIM17106.1 amidase [Leucobacter insecticola]